jgi:uncharacterized protein (TIGR02246 family)
MCEWGFAICRDQHRVTIPFPEQRFLLPFGVGIGQNLKLTLFQAHTAEKPHDRASTKRLPFDEDTLMKSSKLLLPALLLLAVGFALTSAQERNAPKDTPPSNEQSAELNAIRKTSAEFVAAFNRQDAKAVAALWTEKGDYIDETGQTLLGRAAIEEEYGRFFKENPNVKIQVAIDSLRLLSGDAAVEDGRTSLQPPPEGVPALAKYTVVHVKINGKWLMSTVREQRIETSSTHRDLLDFEWLIGKWTSEEHGAKLISEFRWIANKSFIERRYTVTLPNNETSSGTQIIGFNPREGSIQSWDFSPDGGHAVGLWTPLEDGWQAEVQGVTGEGVSTKAINTLKRLDDNAYAWQSLNRAADGLRLPDIDEVVIKREIAISPKTEAGSTKSIPVKR